MTFGPHHPPDDEDMTAAAKLDIFAPAGRLGGLQADTTRRKIDQAHVRPGTGVPHPGRDEHLGSLFAFLEQP
jgi:hypothetical protein